MSLVEDGRRLAGYTLDDVLGNNRLGPPATATRAAEIRGRTLLDVIRDEEPSISKGLFGKDKRTWKSFRDKLRLKRAGSAWVSTVPIPTSDMPVHTKRSLIGRRNQVRFSSPGSRNSGDYSSRNPSEESSKSIRRQMSRQTSTMNSSTDSAFHYDESSDYSSAPDGAPNRLIRPQMSRHTSVRIPNPSEDYTDPTEPDRDNRVRFTDSVLSDRRMMSARETVAAQEAADASAAAAAAAAEEEKEQNENNENENENENENGASTRGLEKEGEEEEEEDESSSEPMRFSLMDLLHETDREMGFEGSSYGMGFGESFFSDDDEDDDYEEDDEDEGTGIEFSCCVCMVKHKNAPLAPCGHTFCRLCSKELMVSRGNCPTCNDFMLEIVDGF